MKIYEDQHVGDKIGIYQVLYLHHNKSKDGHKIYHICCTECGWETDIQYRNIKALSKTCNHLTMCGSYVNFNGKHQWKYPRLKKIFNGMVSRCYNIEHDDYKWYGAKGITICHDWIANPSKFEEWAINNGYQDDLTIDRIDSDDGYTPENCQWIPLVENVRKAGKVNWITVNGETLTGRQWSEKFKLGPNVINTIVRKYDIDVAQKLICQIIKHPNYLQTRKSNQSILSIYNILTD